MKCYKKVGPGKRQPFAAFDFETDGLGGRVLAATWMREGDTVPSWIGDGDIVQRLFDVMVSNPEYTWFAHNAQYDLRYMLDRLNAEPEKLSIYLRTDNDIFMMVVRLDDNVELVIKDSLALFPDKLERFAASMCPDYKKLELDFESETFDPTNPRHKDYALRDAEALLHALINFDSLVFETFGVHCKSTTASTALQAWQRTLDKNEVFYPVKAHDDMIRAAYYGGLVFLTDTNKVNNSKTYDINSSYPYSLMSNTFPIGNPIETTRYEKNKHGIYVVDIEAPFGVIVPIIPKRDKKGLCWPSGRFETTVTSIDLDLALKHGYKLHSTISGIYWEQSCSPFKSFVEKCRSIRFAHKGKPLEKVAKLMQNSLYGKFGTKKERKKLYSWLPDDEAIGCEPWGDYLIRTETDDEMLAMPCWAAFTTAYSRKLLLEEIYRVGPENVVYGDTDSITVRNNVYIPSGIEYGQFKLEKNWKSFRARAPKVYAGEMEDGKIKGAAKGIPRKLWGSGSVMDAIYCGRDEVVSYTVLPPLMQIMKGEPGDVYDAHRSLSKLENSRNWKKLSNGKVEPRSWAEISGLEDDREYYRTSEAG